MDDESWRLQYSSSPPTLPRSFSQKSSSTKVPLPRSFSLKNAPASSSSCYNASSSGGTGNPKSSFCRSSSMKASSSSSTSTSCKSKSSSLPRSASQKGSGSNVTRKYSSLAKEQKARFYIMRRCIAMLVCWHKHGDS